MTQSVKQHPRFGWDDYQRWPDEQRWEIIAGEAFDMSPTPTPRHQAIVGELYAALRPYFAGKRCRLFLAPLDVKLSDQDVVQPDLFVVCERKKIKPTHIDGAPTLVIEVVSPSTELHDRIRKTRLCAAFGVKEFWLVTPYPWLVEVFVLGGKSYRLQRSYSKDDTLRSPTFRGLAVALRSVFAFPLEPGEEIRMVREGRPKYGKVAVNLPGGNA